MCFVVVRRTKSKLLLSAFYKRNESSCARICRWSCCLVAAAVTLWRLRVTGSSSTASDLSAARGSAQSESRWRRPQALPLSPSVVAPNGGASFEDNDLPPPSPRPPSPRPVLGDSLANSGFIVSGGAAGVMSVAACIPNAGRCTPGCDPDLWAFHCQQCRCLLCAFCLSEPPTLPLLPPPPAQGAALGRG